MLYLRETSPKHFHLLSKCLYWVQLYVSDVYSYRRIEPCYSRFLIEVKGLGVLGLFFCSLSVFVPLLIECNVVRATVQRAQSPGWPSWWFQKVITGCAGNRLLGSLGSAVKLRALVLDCYVRTCTQDNILVGLKRKLILQSITSFWLERLSFIVHSNKIRKSHSCNCTLKVI